MMGYREVNLLRDRALRMLIQARRSLSSGDYDIAVFPADQSIQSYLKSVILELSGETPRTHVLRHLFNVLKLALNQPNIDQSVRDNRSLIIRLEDAYINSRHIPREYNKEEAEELVSFAEEAIKFVESLRGKA